MLLLREYIVDISSLKLLMDNCLGNNKGNGNMYLA